MANQKYFKCGAKHINMHLVHFRLFPSENTKKDRIPHILYSSLQRREIKKKQKKEILILWLYFKDQRKKLVLSEMYNLWNTGFGLSEMYNLQR